jgi:alpha-N-arabinofuranosidase
LKVVADRPLTAHATLDPDQTIGLVDRRLFGSFVEHMGRGVYTGIFEPGHPSSDEDGFRGDVIDLVREMGVTTVRYPGGNFVSGYRWEDGVGPVPERPKRLDLAWHSVETNAFGLDEFMRWTAAAGVEPMLTVNLATRGVLEAIDLLEYANHPGGTQLSDQRIAHGAVEPYRIRTWCLGNELDGPWQVGHKTATEYGRLACETARAMRRFDPTLRLVLAGSSAAWMPTFGTWERTVLEEAFEYVDDISLHAYYEEGDDLASFLASGVAMDRYIEDVATIVDEVATAKGSDKRIELSMDEWNVWYLRRHEETFPPTDWAVAPRIAEDAYTVADAVVVGSLLISFLRHADRVTSACMSELVNTIAPIKTEPGGGAWRESTFYPFALTARHARGRAVDLAIAGPSMDTPAYGDVSALDGVAVVDDESGAVSVFMVNRHKAAAVDLSLDLSCMPPVTAGTAVVLTDEDVHAVNTSSHPLRVRPATLSGITLDGPLLSTQLPPVSWAMIRLDKA